MMIFKTLNNTLPLRTFDEYDRAFTFFSFDAVSSVVCCRAMGGARYLG